MQQHEYEITIIINVCTVKITTLCFITKCVKYCLVKGEEKEEERVGSRFYSAFGPWGLESEVTFAHDVPYEQVHEYY